MALSIGLILASAAGAGKTETARAKLLRSRGRYSQPQQASAVVQVKAKPELAISIGALQDRLEALKNKSAAVKKDTQVLQDLFDKQSALVRTLHEQVGQVLWDNAELEAKLIKDGVSISGTTSSALITKHWNKCKFDTLKDLENTTIRLAQLSKMATARAESLKTALNKKSA